MFNKNKSAVTVVTTKQELKAAIQRKDANIEVRGNLAKEMKWLKKLSPQKIISLTALLSTAVVPNPMLPVTISAVAKITGMEIATIILSGTIPIVVILAIFRGYNIEVGVGDAYLRLSAK